MSAEAASPWRRGRSARLLRARASRVRRRASRRTKKTRAHHHPELWGLGLVVVGLILATVLWLGWDGGPVGCRVRLARRRARRRRAARARRADRHRRAHARPQRPRRPAPVPHRSRRRLVGLMIALGEDHGGALGGALGGGLAQVIGEAGAMIVGVALVLAGVMLVTGASAGALLRAPAMRCVRRAPLPALARGPEWTDVLVDSQPHSRPSARLAPSRASPGTAWSCSPIRRGRAVVGRAAAAPAARARRTSRRGRLEPVLRRAPGAAYRLPDRTLLKASPPARNDAADASDRTAEMLVQALANFGVEATIVGTSPARASSATSSSSRPARRSPRSRVSRTTSRTRSRRPRSASWRRSRASRRSASRSRTSRRGW